MAKKADRKAARAHRARLKRGAGDSAKHRAKNKAERRPERDDVANAALRLFLTALVHRPEQASHRIPVLARDLASLKDPFDPVKTTSVVEAMFERHREKMEREVREEAEEAEREM